MLDRFRDLVLAAFQAYICTMHNEFDRRGHHRGGQRLARGGGKSSPSAAAATCPRR